MITCKACATCEHYSQYTEYCRQREQQKSIADECGIWTPKHGEFVPTPLCRPNDREMVYVPSMGSTCIYLEKSDTFGIVHDASDVKCWMRMPADYMEVCEYDPL